MTTNTKALKTEASRLGSTPLPKIIGRWRAYVYDLITRQEIARFACLGTGPNAVVDGALMQDTHVNVEVIDLETAIPGLITERSWANPIAVKLWHPTWGTQWSRIVDGEHCTITADMPRGTMGPLKDRTYLAAA
jgi:hypothetical protein